MTSWLVKMKGRVMTSYVERDNYDVTYGRHMTEQHDDVRRDWRTADEKVERKRHLLTLPLKHSQCPPPQLARLAL